MNRTPVPRPRPKLGDATLITGRPGRHRVVEIRKDLARPAVKVACSPRWYSTSRSRVVAEPIDCERCRP